MRLISTFLIIVFALSLSMCAGSRSKSNVGDYSIEVGVATPFDATDKTRRLLDRHHYELIREENSASGIYLETRWKERQPFEDEKELGIMGGRTRIIIRAQPRSRYGSGMQVSYRMFFVAENEALLPANGGEWRRTAMTKMLKNHIKMIANEFKSEFRTGGMRRF